MSDKYPQLHFFYALAPNQLAEELATKSASYVDKAIDRLNRYHGNGFRGDLELCFAKSVPFTEEGVPATLPLRQGSLPRIFSPNRCILVVVEELANKLRALQHMFFREIVTTPRVSTSHKSYFELILPQYNVDIGAKLSRGESVTYRTSYCTWSRWKTVDIELSVDECGQYPLFDVPYFFVANEQAMGILRAELDQRYFRCGELAIVRVSMDH